MQKKIRAKKNTKCMIQKYSILKVVKNRLGREFDNYSDINCIGLGKSVQSGTCKNVVDIGGLLIINSENNEKITVTVHIEEK